MLERAISLWNKESGTCKLIEGERVKILKRIGVGHFGEVFQGELSADRGENSNILKMNPKLKEFNLKKDQKKIPCAIKTIKRMTKSELLEELQKLEETHTEEEYEKKLEEYEALQKKRQFNEDEELR